MEEARKRDLARSLAQELLDERRHTGGWMLEHVPGPKAPFSDHWLAFRALVNTREALPVNPSFLRKQDQLLRAVIADAGITEAADLPVVPADARISLWRGDITTLQVDAIVNAANALLTGCWEPLHYCIDNAIHTFAGVQLRQECARVMRWQGHPEPAGQAKVTPAYNLPCKRVIHTVGPIVEGGEPVDGQAEELASCYRSCLDAAAAEGLSSIAFCCISTGVFGFPQEAAAQIAIDTVRAWLDAHEGEQMHVVFNVFLEEDEEIYARLLS